MATIRPTSISPSTTSASTSGDWTPYGYLSPMGGMDLLHQSIQWNTEEQIRQAQLSNLRLGAASGGAGGGRASSGGSVGAGVGSSNIIMGMDIGAQQRSLKDILGYISGAYGQVKTEAQSQYEEMLKTLEGTTGQREADIRSSYAGQESNIMQQLARQGMSGTTIAPTMQMGVARERESALNRLADEMLGTKLGVMQGKTGALTQLGVGEISQKLPLYQQLAALGGRV